MAGLCHVLTSARVTLAVEAWKAATAATAHPLVTVVEVLAKVLDPRAAAAESTPIGASLMRLPLTFAAKQPNSSPAVVLDIMRLAVRVAPPLPSRMPKLYPTKLLKEAVPPFPR